MKKLGLLIIAGAVLTGVVAFGWSALENGKALSQLEGRIAQSYPDIEHIAPSTLTSWTADGRPIILLDVREEEEYAVSHLEGAIRVSPQATARDVAQLIGDTADEADVVFYCSVGVRSSELASRAAAQLEEMGVDRIANLRGGVFRWHNEQRPLMVDGQTTELVHPYDSVWKRMVDRKELTTYLPFSGAS